MSSSKRNYIKKAQQKEISSPGAVYPQLMGLLAIIAYHSQELHKHTTQFAETLGIERQGFDYHVQKIKKGKNK